MIHLPIAASFLALATLGTTAVAYNEIPTQPIAPVMGRILDYGHPGPSPVPSTSAKDQCMAEGGYWNVDIQSCGLRDLAVGVQAPSPPPTAIGTSTPAMSMSCKNVRMVGTGCSFDDVLFMDN